MLENLLQNVQVKTPYSFGGNILFPDSCLLVFYGFSFASLDLSTYLVYPGWINPYSLMLFIQLVPCTQVLNSEIIIHL